MQFHVLCPILLIIQCIGIVSLVSQIRDAYEKSALIVKLNKNIDQPFNKASGGSVG